VINTSHYWRQVRSASHPNLWVAACGSKPAYRPAVPTLPPNM